MKDDQTNDSSSGQPGSAEDAANRKSRSERRLPLVRWEDPFEGFTAEQRRDVARAVLGRSRKEFEEKLAQVRDLVWAQEPTLLLSHLSFYFLFGGPDEDPELNPKGDHLPVLQHHIELIQALCLSRPPGAKAEVPLNPQTSQKIYETIVEVAFANSVRRLPDPDNDTNAVRKASALEQVRVFTEAVRNWAYPEQMFRTAKDIWRPLDDDFRLAHGVTAGAMIDMLLGIIRAIEGRAHSHHDKLRTVFSETTIESMADTYCAQFLDDAGRRDSVLALGRKAGSVQRFRELLLFHSELWLPDVFTFTLDELLVLCPGDPTVEALERILDRWSYEPSGLHGHDPETFFLSLPIHERPLIRLREGRYFIPIAGLLVHTSGPLIEGLTTSTSLIRRYERRRARYLEEQTTDLFRRAFPGGQLATGSIWTDPRDGKEYENDLLVVVDHTAFVVECKSAKVTPAARRGGEKSVTSKLKELVLEPAEQALRFRAFLEANRKPLEFVSTSGSTQKIDLSNVARIIPLSITLDLIGPVSSIVHEAEQCGLVARVPTPFVPCMTLADLEIVFELLETQSEKIHYLARRVEFEDIPYVADEVDLLAFYLDTGFVIGEAEFDRTQLGSLNLMVKSKELDPFFVSRFEGIPGPPKPFRRLGRWWRDCIQALELRRAAGWTGPRPESCGKEKWRSLRVLTHPAPSGAKNRRPTPCRTIARLPTSSHSPTT